jgi:hypothetical protein
VSTIPLLVLDFLRAIRGELSEDELVMIQESEDMTRFEDAKHIDKTAGRQPA